LIINNSSKSSSLLSLNIKNNINYLSILTRITDKELFITLYERFKHLINVNHIVKILLVDNNSNNSNSNNTIPIIALAEKGYLTVDEPMNFYKDSFPPDQWHRVNHQILNTLFQYKYIDLNWNNIDDFHFKFTPDSLDVLLNHTIQKQQQQKRKDQEQQPIKINVASKLLSLLLNSGHPMILNHRIRQILEPYKKTIVSGLLYSQLVTSEINDSDLFIYIVENHNNISSDQKNLWFLSILPKGSFRNVDILRYLIETVKIVAFDTDKIIKFIIEHSLKQKQNNSIINYVLDVWQPEYTFETLDLSNYISPNTKLSLSTSSFNQQQQQQCLDLKLLEKLMDRGLDVFLFWTCNYFETGLEEIFYRLWQRVSDRIRVTPEKIYLRRSEHSYSDEQDISTPILKRCFFVCNSELISFLVKQGLTNLESNDEYGVWDYLNPNHKPEKLVGFLRYIDTHSFHQPDTESLLDLLIKAGSPNQDTLFKYIIDKTGVLCNNNNDDVDRIHQRYYFRQSIQNGSLSRLRYLHHDKGIRYDLTNAPNIELEQLETCLIKTTDIPTIEFIFENYDTLINNFVKKDSFIQKLIINENYILFKYILTNCKPFESFDKLIEHATLCNNTILLDYLNK